MQTVKSIIVIVGFVIAFSLACLVSYAEDVPEGIIFFDQSGSVKKYDPGLRSRTLLIEFLKTLTKPYRIVLAGFNEEIHEYVSVVTGAERDIDVLAEEIQKIGARSYVTDLEIPFRYLFERDGRKAIEFVLIISDGEPDIWDGKLRHFSKRVKSDPGYEDLNRQYRKLKAVGLSPDELFARLRHRYYERNLELIEGRLSMLRSGIGDKIVLWDLSGESDYLKSFAEKTGGHYLAMKTGEKVTPVDLLRFATSSLSARSRFTVLEHPPQDHEPPSESEPKPKPKSGIERRPERARTTATSRSPSPDLGDETKKPLHLTEKQIPEKGMVGWAIAAAVALFLLIGVGGIFILSRFRKKALLDETGIQDTGKGLQLVDLSVEDYQERLGDIISASIEEASNYLSNYIDGEINRAMGEAEGLWDKLIQEEAKALKLDRRFSIRMTVPSGAMEVHWTNKDGMKMRAQAVNISIDGVLFEAPDFMADSIDRIVCPGLDAAFNIKRSRIHRKEGGMVVAVLEEFEGNVDDSMRWVEILTSIGEAQNDPGHAPS